MEIKFNPVFEKIGLPIVDCVINKWGESISFIIDTGADSSKIFNFVRKGMPQCFTPCNRTELTTSVNGDQQSGEIVMADINLGDKFYSLEFTTIEHYSIVKMLWEKYQVKLVGMLGNDILRFGKYKVDFKNQSLSISDNTSNTSTNSHLKASFEPTFKRHCMPLIGIHCDDIPEPLMFIVDTGANANLIFPNAYTRLDKSLNKHDFANNVIGIDGVSTKATSCEIILNIGEYQCSHNFDLYESMGTVEMFKNEGIEVHGLLGTNFISAHQLAIDFSTLTIYSQLQLS